MPGMLGWFKMTPETSIEDVEWMLARSAGFDAGYAFVTSFETLAENHHSDAILRLLGEWEQVRMAELLGERQKEKMKNIKNDFSLKAIKEGEWDLYQVFSYRYQHEQKGRQPGEPTGSSFTFTNPSDQQNFHFRLTAVGGNIEHVKLELDNYKTLKLPLKLQQGEFFKYTGGNRVVIYNRNWAEKGTVDLDADFFNITRGDHQIHFDCRFSDTKPARANIELRLFGPPEKIKAKSKTRPKQ
jgi:hypothetical protein